MDKITCKYSLHRAGRRNASYAHQVAIVWTLDTTHQGLIIHSVYVYLITEYANPAFLNVIVDTLLVGSSNVFI